MPSSNMLGFGSWFNFKILDCLCKYVDVFDREMSKFIQYKNEGFCWYFDITYYVGISTYVIKSSWWLDLNIRRNFKSTLTSLING